MSKNNTMLNDSINATEVRLIDSAGEQHGIVKIAFARALADEQSLDLVMVAPEAKPPVCKILDWGKHQYELSKNQRKNKQTKVGVKEVQLKPNIDTHDLDTKLRKAQGFLDKGHKVRFIMRFRGRENAHTDIGMNIIKDVQDRLDDVTIEKEPKLEGNRILMIVAPENKNK